MKRASESNPEEGGCAPILRGFYYDKLGAILLLLPKRVPFWKTGEGAWYLLSLHGQVIKCPLTARSG